MRVRVQKRRGRSFIVAVTALMVVGLVQPVAHAAPPANDDRSSATSIGVLPFDTVVSTVEATTATDDPTCRHSGSGTVWLKYTAGTPIALEVEASGTGFDTAVAVYKEVDGRLVDVACQSGVEAWARFSAAAGETFYFMVSSTKPGQINFGLHQQPPAPTVQLELVKNGVINAINGAAIVRGSVTCSREIRLELYGSIEQDQGSTTRRGAFYETVDCTTEGYSWAFPAEPSSGSFKKGLADLTVRAHSYREGINKRADATVRLQEVCSVIGTPEDDELDGFPGADTICGLGGDDMIHGRGGNDRLIGGPGRDALFGDAGDDTLIGGPGEGVNRLNGGAGSDRCKRETRRDTLRSCETKL